MWVKGQVPRLVCWVFLSRPSRGFQRRGCWREPQVDTTEAYEHSLHGLLSRHPSPFCLMGMSFPPYFPKSLITETWVCEHREEGLNNYRVEGKLAVLQPFLCQEDLFKNNKKPTSIELT